MKLTQFMKLKIIERASGVLSDYFVHILVLVISPNYGHRGISGQLLQSLIFFTDFKF